MRPCVHSRAPLHALVLASAVLAQAGALGTSCRPEDDDDDVPPRLLGLVPRDPVVPVDTMFRLSFSEALNPKTVSSDVTSELLSLALVPRTGADGVSPVFNDAFLGDLDNPPLSDSRIDDVVPLDVTLESNDTVIAVAPRAPLAPNRAYVLVVSAVRDTSGNPLVDASGLKAPFIWEFTTDAGQPRVLSTSVDTGVVVPNVRRISVTFDQPVTGVDQATLRIAGADGAASPVVEATLMDEGSRTATLLLANGTGCERLTPGGSYVLEASSGIRGLAGQALAASTRPFTASASCDLVEPAITDLSVAPADVSALVRFFTNKPSTTEVRFGVAGGALDCLGGECPVVGASTRALDEPHLVTIPGLTVDVDYAFTVSAEDDVGFVASASGTFRTSRLPRVTINEAMANPTTASDGQGEFVELASYEASDTVTLDGWRLRVTKLPVNAAETPNEAAIPEATALAPGAFLVLADAAFVPESYPGLAAAAVVAFADFDGLQNQAILIELIDTGGRVVSSMTSPAPREGQSFERVRVDAPDEAASYCFSRADTGPSPGRENGVTMRGCE